MRYLICGFILLFLLIENVECKKQLENFRDAKVAVEVDIKDITAQVRLGVTVFDMFKSAEHNRMDMKANIEGESIKSKVKYNMPDYVIEHIDGIFNELDIEYEFVVRQKPTDNQLANLNKRAQRKLYKKAYDDFLKGLKSQGFTELLSFKFFPHDIRKNGPGTPLINGYGLYKIPGSNCLYHTLGYFHIDLSGRKKDIRYDVIETIPEKEKMDHVCMFGKDVKPLGVPWKKSITDYTSENLDRIELLLKQLVLRGMLDTFKENGIIEQQKTANFLYVTFTMKDYTVIEKISFDKFAINEKEYSLQELQNHLQDMVKGGLKEKVLIGMKTKSQYTFGDLKEIFIPVLKDSLIDMFRLGPNYELIKI